MEWCKGVFGAMPGFIFTVFYTWAIAAVLVPLAWIAARALHNRPACPVCGCSGTLPYVEFKRLRGGSSSFEVAKYGDGRRVFLNCERCNP
jgi:hypothetical protein